MKNKVEENIVILVKVKRKIGWGDWETGHNETGQIKEKKLTGPIQWAL